MTTTTVDNCDQEPIHIPGAIQPHGVLLALRASDLVPVQASDNTGALLGIEPRRLFGLPLEEILDPASAALVRANQGARSWARMNPVAAQVNHRRFDMIVHRSDDLLLLEMEPTDLVPQGSYRDHGADTHQAMVRLQGADSLGELLQTAAEVVRWVTGYDRVMIYRFDDDGHGQVVAEDRPPSLEPFLGLHYPASDIPAQARRLYLLNWLRIITDVDYQRAELLAAPERAPDGPLDLTHSTLRSVSPIHIEYLKNMGVRASMSVSLVLDGKLWGLIACHHYTPRFVPYSVRMACELLGRMLSTLILAGQRKDDAAVAAALGQLRVHLVENLAKAEYIAAGLRASPDDLLGLVGASGAAILEEGRFTAVGDCPTEQVVRAFAAWVAEGQHEVLASARLTAEFPAAPALGPDFAGVLALALPDTSANAVLWFRPPVERNVSWAGQPEKGYTEGPNGPRLTPRGSFALWKETVRNQSEPWSPLELEAARDLRRALADFTIRKGREAENARDMLIGIVSHDLRAPLGAISLAAQLLKLEQGEPGSVTRASARIASSSDRMRRMIEQLLDYTRAKAGSLELRPRDIDLVQLCRQIAEETADVQPGVNIQLDLPAACRYRCDPDRMAQVIANLLSNSSHHGDPGQPVSLVMRCRDQDVQIQVANRGQPIPADRLPGIFEPFKRGPDGARSSRHAGLGLGLFIVKRLVEMHAGQVGITSSLDAGTVCTVTLPRQPAGA
jgi:two-component system, chemotaxis family, sensor kinase Cph1